MLRNEERVSVDNRARREALEQLDIFEKLPGVTDRSRLRVGLDCKRAPVAATLISGEHLDNRAWAAAPLPAPGKARAA